MNIKMGLINICNMIYKITIRPHFIAWQRALPTFLYQCFCIVVFKILALIKSSYNLTILLEKARSIPNLSMPCYRAVC